MSGFLLGQAIMASVAKTAAQMTAQSGTRTSATAATPETSGPASLNLTTVLPLGSVPAGLLSGEYDRVGHHTSLLNASSGQIGTSERAGTAKSRCSLCNGSCMTGDCGCKNKIDPAVVAWWVEYMKTLDADCGQCGRDAASCNCDFGV